MPQNGDVNKTFGVYRSLCCGQEIVIPAGAAFPECPMHPRLSTKWNFVEDVGPLLHTSETAVRRKKNRNRAA